MTTVKNGSMVGHHALRLRWLGIDTHEAGGRLHEGGSPLPHRSFQGAWVHRHLPPREVQVAGGDVSPVHLL